MGYNKGAKNDPNRPSEGAHGTDCFLRLLGDCEQAELYLAESLAILQEFGNDELRAWRLFHFAVVAQRWSDYERAQMLLGESLKLFYERQPSGIASCLEGMTAIREPEERPRQVVRLFGAAAAIRAIVGIPLFPEERIAYDRALAAARVQLGEAAYAAAWAAGQALTLEQAIAEALAGSAIADRST